MPSNKLRHFRLSLLASTPHAILDYWELKAQVAALEREIAERHAAAQKFVTSDHMERYKIPPYSPTDASAH